ncbi:MAG TPA: alginate lyase family protein, partial [Longimicrobiales bacterium]|nr:alginate lyase family protein [Longimicrobiales bacterium]
MKRTAVLTMLFAMTLTSGVMAQDPFTSAVDQYVATASTLNPAHGIPRATQRNGSWAFSTTNYWTSGFYAGTLWYLSTTRKNPELRSLAERWTLPLANIPFGSFSHDVGFQFNQAFINAYRFTAEERFRGPALNAARLLSLRFNPKVGAIKSWDWMPPERPYPVIADNMMNLELLFWGARQSNGDKNWYNLAVQHARTTLREHIRPDGGSYHVIVFDPNTGKVIERITHQGFAHNSTWARGQAWLVYGFTMAFRETGHREFLDAARKVSDYFINHLPEDGIPCWDFNAPGCPETVLRDASAAAIAASGLLELSTYVEKQSSVKYRSTADRILSALSSSQYRSTDGAALLKHSVGNMPGNSEVDVGIVYADYYYVEALLRQKQMNGDTSVHIFPARLPVTYTARADLLRKSKERIHRGDAELRPILAKLIANADSALKLGPFTVTAKERVPPSGDKHDYVSYAPYWWPDSTKPNGLPFIRRDGEVNQTTRRDSDVLRWYAFTDAVETLAHSFYFSDDVRYADRAAVLLRAWFLDPATRMNPNVNYGQAIPGVVEGRGIGLIDQRDFGRLLDAVSILEASPAWSDKDDTALRDWLRQYTTWLTTSKNGVDEAGEKNNHGTWYDVQLGALQLFLGDTASARALFEQAKEKRIAGQIDSIGQQPLEIARTRSL